MRKRQNENGIRGILLLKNLLKIMLFASITNYKNFLRHITIYHTKLYDPILFIITQQI